MVGTNSTGCFDPRNLLQQSVNMFMGIIQQKPEAADHNIRWS